MPQHAEQRLVLDVSSVRVSYPGFTLGPVDLTVAPNTYLTLVGPNGSGKSTLIRAVLGLQAADAGSSWWGPDNLVERDPRVLAQIGYVTDSVSDLLDELTVEEYWQYCRAARAPVSEVSSADMRARAGQLAELLRLPLTRKRLSDLSLGTRRKAQIIAALMMQPALLVLDEVFSGLDFIASRALESILAETWRSGVTVISSSHDLDLTARLSTDVALLYEGRLLFYSPVSVLGGAEHIETAILDSLAAGPIR